MDGVDYEVFIVPGLIAMAMVQAAYANNASTVFQARSDRYVNDILSAPMHPWQMTLGFVVGGFYRALRDRRRAAGAVRGPHRRAGGAAVRAGRRGGARPGAVRGARARWSASTRETWDHTTFIANIVILPLAFLGGTFYSVDLLPSPWEELSHFNPLFYLVQAMRFGFLGKSDVSIWLSLGGDRGAGHPGLPVGPVAVHDRPQAEGLAHSRRGCRAAAARGWWSGASGWRARSGRRSATRSTGAGPVPGFGDPAAPVYVLGLAPAAHGANRTGRVFTGDRSGDWLFASMHRTGFANQPASVALDDGLRLDGAFVAAAVRCAPPANKPLPAERDNCLPYAREELDLLEPRVIVCLGAYAWDAACRLLAIRPKPQFGHGAEHRVEDGPLLLGCFHPSQQNTFTGKLTEEMTDAVFASARRRRNSLACSRVQISQIASPAESPAASGGRTGEPLGPTGPWGESSQCDVAHSFSASPSANPVGARKRRGSTTHDPPLRRSSALRCSRPPWRSRPCPPPPRPASATRRCAGAIPAATSRPSSARSRAPATGPARTVSSGAAPSATCAASRARSSAGWTGGSRPPTPAP